MSPESGRTDRVGIAELRQQRERRRGRFSSRLRRWLAVAAALVLLFTVVGFFVVPPIARSQLEKRLSKELGRRVTVQKVKTNPFAFSATLENVSILESDNSTRFLGWRRLHVNVDPWSSWQEWAVKEIALDGFQSRVVVNPDNSLNFSDLLAKFAPPDAEPKPANEKPARPVRIGSLRVTDTRVDFTDRSRPKPFTTAVGPLSFALTEFRTVSQTGAPYRFEAVTEAGEKLAWVGTVKADPPASSGELSLENIILSKYAPYYGDRIQADVIDGRLTVRGRYEVSLAGGGRVATLRDGAVQLRDVKLLERATGENVFELPALDVSGIQGDAMTLRATVDRIALTGGQVRVRRGKDEQINLIQMLQPPLANVAPAPTPPPGAMAASAPPDITVGEVALQDFRIEIADHAAPRPTQLALGDLQLSLRNVTLAEGARMPLQLAFTWAPQGTVRVDGNVALTPLTAELTVDVATLDLLPLSAYLEQFVNARLTQGTVTTGLMIEASKADGQTLAASLVGGVKLENFGLVDGVKNEELAGFGAVTLRGLNAKTGPELSIAIDEIEIADPSARVVVNQDATLNLATILPTEPAAAEGTPAAQETTPSSQQAASSPASETSAPKPAIEIGEVTIRGGDFRFVDRSLEPNVSMALNHFEGRIAGLSSTNPAKADLDIKAMVDGAGPIAIVGKIDPLGTNRTFDLKVDFKNVDLVPLSAYSGKFAGYELARGKLLLDVKLNVAGEKIDATNVITLNQFTFGSQVKSPEATKLPVRLGVALLKDRDGKIVIDIPVQGSTTDPSFRVGRVVSRAIVNLLTKVATSPFALLGSAFGGGGEELAYQEFNAGSTELRPGEVRKLETLVKALTDRPGLSLDLRGGYDPVADTPALKEARLADAVRRAVWEEKHAANPNTPPPAQLVITPEEEAAMLKKLYDDVFPPGTRFGAPVPPPPAMLPAPLPPDGAFSRLIDSITGRTEREAKAVQQENARRVAEHARAIEAAVATGLPSDEMRQRLLQETIVDENDLRALALARAQRVRDYFVNVGGIAPDRLFLAKDQTAVGDVAKGPRVVLGLQ